MGVIAALVGILLAASALAVEAPAVCPVGTGGAVKIADVIDGDTIGLTDGSIVRLAGVEAPRLPLGRPDDQPWPLADEARQALEKLAGGQAVRLAPAGGGPDRYGRIHAYLSLSDGRSVQAELVAAGLARVRWLPEESSCFQYLLIKERTARNAARGIWASPEYAVRRADDEASLLQRTGIYELVEGRVVSVGHGNRMIFLDFGWNYRRDFTVMVSPAVAELLAAGGSPPDDFANRRIRVRGVIEDSNGPAMRLNDPGEIELID